MPKTQSNIQPMSIQTHILYRFLCGTQGFSLLQYPVQVDTLGVNFLFIPYYFSKKLNTKRVV